MGATEIRKKLTHEFRRILEDLPDELIRRWLAKPDLSEVRDVLIMRVNSNIPLDERFTQKKGLDIPFTC